MDFNDPHDYLTYYDPPRLGEVHRSVNEGLAASQRNPGNYFGCQMTDHLTEHLKDLSPKRPKKENLVGFGLIMLWCTFLLWI